MEAKYNIELQNRFQALEPGDDINSEWENIVDTINRSVEAIVGKRRGSRKERWITADTWRAIDERRVLKGKKEQAAKTRNDLDTITEEYKTKDKEVKQKCERDKARWFNQKASEAGEATKLGNTKALYRIVKELAGGNTKRPQIKLGNGKYATSHEQQMKRWEDHFAAVLNCPEPGEPHDFTQECLETPVLDVSLDPITEEEVQKAIKRLNNGKSSGIDHIQPELLKHAEAIVPHLTSLFNKVWRSKEVPSDWRNGIIIPLPKKGDLADCNNWRGITLLSVPGSLLYYTVGKTKEGP